MQLKHFKIQRIKIYINNVPCFWHLKKNFIDPTYCNKNSINPIR